MSDTYDYNKVAISGVAICGKAVCGYDRLEPQVIVGSMVDDIRSLLMENGYGRGNSAICGIAICGKAILGKVDSNKAIPIYKRNVPQSYADLITLISTDGTQSEKSNVAIDYPTLTVVSQSLNIQTSRRRMKEIHDILLNQLPREINGTHYYHARAYSTGQFERKTASGPVYIHTTDFEIKQQSTSYIPKAETIEGKDNIDIIASYIESIVKQRCYRGQAPHIGGTVYSIVQTGGSESDDRIGDECLSDYVNFDISIRGEDIAKTNQLAIDLQRTIHLTRHVGPINSITAYSPRYQRGNERNPRHTYIIRIETDMERI